MITDCGGAVGTGRCHICTSGCRRVVLRRGGWRGGLGRPGGLVGQERGRGNQAAGTRAGQRQPAGPPSGARAAGPRAGRGGAAGGQGGRGDLAARPGPAVRLPRAGHGWTAAAVPGCRVRVRFAGRLSVGLPAGARRRPASSQGKLGRWSGWSRPSRCSARRSPAWPGPSPTVTAARWPTSCGWRSRRGTPPPSSRPQLWRRPIRPGATRPRRRPPRPPVPEPGTWARYEAGAAFLAALGRRAGAARGLVRAARPALAGGDRPRGGGGGGGRPGHRHRACRTPGTWPRSTPRWPGCSGRAGT